MSTEKDDAVKAWELHVRTEVENLLDTFLPNAKEGIVGIKYISPIKSVMEDGTVELDSDKAEGVKIILEFSFDNVVDISGE